MFASARSCAKPTWERAADDLVQQVLVMLLEARRAGRLRDPDKVAHFVMGTRRMTVLDQHRGTRWQEQLLVEFGADPAPASLAGPSIDGHRLRRCVRGAEGAGEDRSHSFNPPC